MNLILIALFILILYTFGWILFHLDTNMKFNAYIQSLYYMSVFVLLMSFIYEYNKKNMEDHANEIITINNIQTNSFIMIEKMFLDNYPYSCELYKQINSHNSELAKLPNQKITDNIKKHLFELNMSNILIQNIENALMSWSLLNENIESFEELVRTWTNWFKSPILINNYKTNKFLFASSTCDFIDNKLVN